MSVPSHLSRRWYRQGLRELADGRTPSGYALPERGRRKLGTPSTDPQGHRGAEALERDGSRNHARRRSSGHRRHHLTDGAEPAEARVPAAFRALLAALARASGGSCSSPARDTGRTAMIELTAPPMWAATVSNARPPAATVVPDRGRSPSWRDQQLAGTAEGDSPRHLALCREQATMLDVHYRLAETGRRSPPDPAGLDRRPGARPRAGHRHRPLRARGPAAAAVHQGHGDPICPLTPDYTAPWPRRRPHRRGRLSPSCGPGRRSPLRAAAAATVAAVTGETPRP